MITINYPTSRRYEPARFEFGVRGPAVINSSPTLGALSITPTAAPRWVATVSYAVDEDDRHPILEALVAQIGGQSNLLSMWHLMRPVPQGTLRGTPQLSATATKGATTAQIVCDSGATVKRGDMLGIGSQVVMVTADATASGTALTIAFRNPLRESVNSGTSVVWDKPAITWVSESPDVYVPYADGFGEPFAMSFVEHW